MMNKKSSRSGISRRKFIGAATAATATLAFPALGYGHSSLFSGKPDSNFGGVQIGAITYSWRSMPGSAEDILNYCIEAGISSIELMGNVVEAYAGIPPSAGRPPREASLSDDEKETYRKAAEEAREEQRKWRETVSMSKFRPLKKMFNRAGVNIHIVKFSPANWSDKETDYAFKAAKVLGAKGVSNEIGHEACQRLGKFAEKHNMYAIFHNHGQPGNPGFSFDEFLAYSPNNMLNFDVGHYFGATGEHPNQLIERLHSRIFSIHLKDKTGKTATPSDTNRPWGEGDTPLADILLLIKNKKWPIYCDIELEYQVPEGSNAQKEIMKCVDYCRDILV